MNNDKLYSWAKQVCPMDLESLIELKGDAGHRKYYRARGANKSLIIVSDNNLINLQHFSNIASYLKTLDLCVPEVHSMHPDEPWAVLSDLGDNLYGHELKVINYEEKRSYQLYLDAIQAILKLQYNTALKVHTLDAAYIKKQLDFWQTWYLEQHLKLDISNTNLSDVMESLYHLFVEVFTLEPQVLVHLDYHSRNLLVMADNNPGIIDFQDLAFGPTSYDLVSLLQDAYVSWPREFVIKLLREYYYRAQELMLTRLSFNEFLRCFDLVGLERHLKNLGVFARLYHKYKKPHFIHDIPMLLKYILSTIDLYKELNVLKKFMLYHVLPRVQVELA